jgi:hypothetical protein
LCGYYGRHSFGGFNSLLRNVNDIDVDLARNKKKPKNPQVETAINELRKSG